MIALAVLVVAGWWAVKTFWLTAPLGTPTEVVVTYGFFSPPGSNVPPKNLIFYKVGGDVTAPIPIFKPDPPYTPQAKNEKVQGTSVLAVTVDASGNVVDARVLKSLRADLDESALKTVRTWRFQPAIRKGKPVPVRVMVETSFRFF